MLQASSWLYGWLVIWGAWNFAYWEVYTDDGDDRCLGARRWESATRYGRINVMYYLSWMQWAFRDRFDLIEGYLVLEWRDRSELRESKRVEDGQHNCPCFA